MNKPDKRNPRIAALRTKAAKILWRIRSENKRPRPTAKSTVMDGVREGFRLTDEELNAIPTELTFATHHGKPSHEPVQTT